MHENCQAKHSLLREQLCLYNVWQLLLSLTVLPWYNFLYAENENIFGVFFGVFQCIVQAVRLCLLTHHSKPFLQQKHYFPLRFSVVFSSIFQRYAQMDFLIHCDKMI